MGDVFICWEFCGLFELWAILPQIFVFGTPAHGGAGRVGALFDNGSVDEVDPVEKVDQMYGEPFADILTRWQFDSLSKIYAWV